MSLVSNAGILQNGMQRRRCNFYFRRSRKIWSFMIWPLRQQYSFGQGWSLFWLYGHFGEFDLPDILIYVCVLFTIFIIIKILGFWWQRNFLMRNLCCVQVMLVWLWKGKCTSYYCLVICMHFVLLVILLAIHSSWNRLWNHVLWEGVLLLVLWLEPNLCFHSLCNQTISFNWFPVNPKCT